MKTSNIFCLLAALLLPACVAPSTAPTYSQAPAAAPREGVAVLYVYREYAEPTAWKPTIYVDGKEVVSLPQQGFSWVYLSPGKHTLSSRWPRLAAVPPVEFSADYAAGTRYFFEISGTSRMTGTSGITMHFKTTAQVKSAQEREAIQQLQKCCRFITPTAITP